MHYYSWKSHDTVQVRDQHNGISAVEKTCIYLFLFIVFYIGKIFW